MKPILFISLISFCINVAAQVPHQPRTYGIGDPDYLTVEGIPEGKFDNAGYYQKDGKYGFVYPEDNRQEAIYDRIVSSSKNFIIKKGSLYGITDLKGNLIGKIEFDSIGSPSYLTNDAFIVKKKGKYGTLSETGKPILSIKYNKILFSGSQNPISFVKDKNGTVALIFNQQEKPFPHKIEYAEVYANLTILKVNGKFGVVKNQTIVPFEYDSLFVPTPEGYNNKTKKAKKTNPFVFEYSKVSKTVNYLTIQKNGKYGLINSDGTIIYPAENDQINSVEMKNYCTAKKDKLYGIYFMASKEKTAIEFSKVYADGTGYVMAEKNKKAGVFNSKGEEIIPFEYDPEFIAQYNFGLKVTKDKKKGFTDKSGKLIIPPVYDDVESFYQSDLDHFIKVKSGEKLGVINLKNEVIIPADFEWIGEENGYFKVVTPEPDRKCGLYGKTGKLIVPAEYRWITNSDTEDSKITILVKDSNSYNFLNEKAQLIFPENLSQYGYVLNEHQLLNPYNTSHQLFVKDKNGKFGMLNEKTGLLDIPMIYDTITQCFESEKHAYYSVRKGKKMGLINEKNQEIIPFNYDTVDINFVDPDYEAKTDDNYAVIAAKGNKFGTLNLKNEIQIPFQYSELKRISGNGLYKAKKGKYYQIINSKNEVLNAGPFDQIANFEQINFRNDENPPAYQALTFYNGKMKVVNEKGKFITEETAMQPHKGYVTFDELKQSLIKAFDSQDDTLLKDFAEKIAPSEHLLYYLKNNPFDNKPLEYTNINYIKEKYYNELLNFKRNYWKSTSGLSYNHNSLTDVTDYTFYKRGLVTNERTSDHAFGNTRILEKFLRNSIKINDYWISSYFMTRNFYRD